MANTPNERSGSPDAATPWDCTTDGVTEPCGECQACKNALATRDHAAATLREVACPDCWKGKAIPCAVNCRDSDECCDKRLGYPCERCGGSGVLRVAA